MTQLATTRNVALPQALVFRWPQLHERCAKPAAASLKEELKAQASVFSDKLAACKPLRQVFDCPGGTNRLLHGDGSHHARVDGTGVTIGSGLVEAEREALVGIERPGAKQPALTDHRVWLIVAICPGNGRAGGNAECGGRKHEVLRHHDCGSP